MKKENNNHNYVLFSDSIGKGLYFDENLNIQKLKYNVCDLFKTKSNIDITNNSVFGQTLKRLDDKKQIDKYLSTINKEVTNTCIIWLGGNDSDYDWSLVSLNPDKFYSSRTNIYEFEDILINTIKKLKDNNVNVILVSILPVDSNRYFNNVLCKKYNGENILKFLKNDLTNLYRHQELFNNCILKCAYSTNTTLIDLRSILLKDNSFLSMLSSDGIHLNESGQDFIYNYLKLFIKSNPTLFNNN